MNAGNTRKSTQRPTRRLAWASSRGRLVYNMILSGIATACGLILAVVPGLFGANDDARMMGGVLTGYGAIRGYHFYRRWRSHLATGAKTNRPETTLGADGGNSPQAG